MSDHADTADNKIYQAIADGLAAARQIPLMQADCHCHFCDEVVGIELLFCDINCRDDYQRELSAGQRSGKIGPA